MQLARIEQLLVGKAVPFTAPGSHSAIAKQPLSGPMAVGSEGLTGDEQGDRRVHGAASTRRCITTRSSTITTGVLSSAIHRCSSSPVPSARTSVPHGLGEADLCLGDVLRCGDVLLQVAQTRQPCWKLNDRFGVPDMALRVQQSGLTGWYYQVLEPGQLQAGQMLARAAPLQAGR